MECAGGRHGLVDVAGGGHLAELGIGDHDRIAIECAIPFGTAPPGMLERPDVVDPPGACVLEIGSCKAPAFVPYYAARPSARSRALLGCAPIVCDLGSPSSNRMTFGIDCTP
jgi:hypothetical protein